MLLYKLFTFNLIVFTLDQIHFNPTAPQRQEKYLGPGNVIIAKSSLSGLLLDNSKLLLIIGLQQFVHMTAIFFAFGTISGFLRVEMTKKLGMYKLLEITCQGLLRNGQHI